MDDESRYDFNCYQVDDFTNALSYDDNADAFFDSVENQATREVNSVTPKVTGTPRRDSGCPQSMDATVLRQTRSSSSAETTSIPSKICTSLSDWKKKDLKADQIRSSPRNITKEKKKLPTRPVSVSRLHERTRSASLKRPASMEIRHSRSQSTHRSANGKQLRSPQKTEKVVSRPVSVSRLHERTRSTSFKRPASMEIRLSRSQSTHRSADVKPLTNPQKTEKPKLTMPQTPSFLKREQTKTNKQMKSQEELEMEKVADYRKQLSAAMKKSKESLKSALSGQAPTLASAPLATTRPQTFNFATDQRVKTHPMQTRIDPQQDFASGLRSHPKSPVSEQNTSQETRKARKRVHSPTKVEPFNFHDKKRKENTDSKQFHSVAEQINNFARKTPDRFHSKTSDRGPVLTRKALKLTHPETPKLETRLRDRPKTAPTLEELEDKELEEIKKNQFKAKPVNEKAFSEPFQLHKSTKVATKTEAFKLDERRTQKKDSAKKTQEKSYEFQAQPVPKNILTRTVGVKKVQSAATTRPVSPAFALKNRVRTAPAPPKLKEESKPVLSHSMQFPGLPMKPKLEHFSTHAKPFSFEERNRRKREQKEEMIKKIIEDEKKGHDFYAKPLPIHESSAVLPVKQTKSPTRTKPFNLKVDERGSKKADEWGCQVEEDLRKQRELAHFQARDPAVLYSEPFIPQKSTKPLTDTMNFQLNTEQRKDQRHDWESHQKQKELEIMEAKTAREKAEYDAAEKEVKHHRAEAVRAAQPIRHYKAVDKAPSKALTQPQTPKFSDRLRLRSARM